MNESYNKKILVYGIILLFIGAAVVPSISGYTEKNDFQSIREAPASSPIDDNDFINAYWKFDECSGNTVGDSSGHNYDGIRYGATWTPDGYSNCALIFDGVNDYVDLSSYAKELGINKTDDFTISCHFKTSSDNPGIIYSATGYKNIPEFRMVIPENGSFSLKIWTTLCGILLFSKRENLNNGLWHEVEIIFNGITTDPTIEIYIDDNLESKTTEWLCDIQSIDWEATAFGKRASDDTGFFDGSLDEFKFIKFEGGNEQAIPEISGPTFGDPGIIYDYTFVTNDPEGDQVWIKVDWADGEITEWLGPYDSGQGVTLSHSWDDDGRYFIKARSQDKWHTSGWSPKGYEVRIGNQAPDPPIINGPRYGDPYVEYTYTFRASDWENNNVKYVIDWDDGTTTETDYFPSNTSVQLSHSWKTNNDYNITAKAIDTNDKVGDQSYYHIRIGDQPPNKPKIYGAVQGIPNVKYDYAFISIDPENDNVSYDIDWGDGNIETDIGPLRSGKVLSRSHSWDKSRTYLIKARAKDKFDYYSDWSEFEIIIPRNKAFNFNLLEMLFERFPRAFHTFKYLLGI